MSNLVRLSMMRYCTEMSDTIIEHCTTASWKTPLPERTVSRKMAPSEEHLDGLAVLRLDGAIWTLYPAIIFYVSSI